MKEYKIKTKVFFRNSKQSEITILQAHILTFAIYNKNR